MLESAIRTAITYFLLVASMRIMGKRQLGDWQPAELVVTLLIADIAAIALEDIETPIWRSLIPLFILVLLELLMSGIILKIPAIARLIGGHEVILINHGELNQKAMKKLRLSIDDMLAALRQQGVFNVADVEYAIAETSGNISLFLKPDKAPATRSDTGITPADDGIPFLVISDGKLSHWGLHMSGHTEDWLYRTLSAASCTVADVFLLTADRNGNTHLIKKAQDN